MTSLHRSRILVVIATFYLVTMTTALYIQLSRPPENDYFSKEDFVFDPWERLTLLTALNFIFLALGIFEIILIVVMVICSYQEKICKKTGIKRRSVSGYQDNRLNAGHTDMSDNPQTTESIYHITGNNRTQMYGNNTMLTFNQPDTTDRQVYVSDVNGEGNGNISELDDIEEPISGAQIQENYCQPNEVSAVHDGHTDTNNITSETSTYDGAEHEYQATRRQVINGEQSTVSPNNQFQSRPQEEISRDTHVTMDSNHGHSLNMHRRGRARRRLQSQRSSKKKDDCYEISFLTFTIIVGINMIIILFAAVQPFNNALIDEPLERYFKSSFYSQLIYNAIPPSTASTQDLKKTKRIHQALKIIQDQYQCCYEDNVMEGNMCHYGYKNLMQGNLLCSDYVKDIYVQWLKRCMKVIQILAIGFYCILGVGMLVQLVCSLRRYSKTGCDVSCCWGRNVRKRINLALSLRTPLPFRADGTELIDEQEEIGDVIPDSSSNIVIDTEEERKKQMLNRYLDLLDPDKIWTTDTSISANPQQHNITGT